MKFGAKLIPSDNATGVKVPDEIMKALGPQARPLVSIIINGHSWHSRIAAMRGPHLIGISAAHRAAAKISEGDMIQDAKSADIRERRILRLIASLKTMPPRNAW